MVGSWWTFPDQNLGVGPGGRGSFTEEKGRYPNNISTASAIEMTARLSSGINFVQWWWSLTDSS